MRCMPTTRPHDQVNGVTAHKACRCFGQRGYHWQIEHLDSSGRCCASMQERVGGQRGAPRCARIVKSAITARVHQARHSVVAHRVPGADDVVVSHHTLAKDYSVVPQPVVSTNTPFYPEANAMLRQLSHVIIRARLSPVAEYQGHANSTVQVPDLMQSQ